MTDEVMPLGAGLTPPAPSPESVEKTVDAITARDPAFNLDAFLAEAQQAFWLVGQAHETCKPELCQSVLSPNLAERETAAIMQACEEGTVRAPRDEDASSGQLVSIDSDANRDTAIVHFTSVWSTTSKGSKGGKGGKAGKGERRVENWCFQRVAAAQTVLPGAGDRCHNCGASLESSAGRCRYCGTPISSDGGWRVIRVDEVGQQEAAQAVATMREIMAGFAAARAAAATAPPVEHAPARRRSTVGGLLRFVFFAVLVAAGVVLAAVGGGGSLHTAVAKVVPQIRYPVLKGPAVLSGRVTAPAVTLTQVVPHFHTGGTCAKEAARTSWEFKGKLPDGSAFVLEFGLPPAAGGPGTFHRPPLTLSASADNRSSSISWTTTPATNATLVVQPDGTGDLQFANLVGDRTSGGAPLNGHLIWTCKMG